MRYGPDAAVVAACLLAVLGVCHLLLPDLAWRLYRRPQPYPDDSTRFNLRLLGAAMVAFAGLVGTVAYLF